MPGKLRRNDYDLVEEAFDNKSPVHNEDAFEHGIAFKVKVSTIREICFFRLPFNQIYRIRIVLFELISWDNFFASGFIVSLYVDFWVVRIMIKLRFNCDYCVKVRDDHYVYAL